MRAAAERHARRSSIGGTNEVGSDGVGDRVDRARRLPVDSSQIEEDIGHSCSENRERVCL